MTGKEIKDYLEYSYDMWINTIDSAGGLIYKVDVTKPKGDRVCIGSLADGTAFDESASYNVAMTSYRASGGGNIMREGAGVDPATIGDRTVIGEWSFVPEDLASKAMDRDMKLMFPGL